MAVRLDENGIIKGTIDNRTMGKTIVKIEFTDGFFTEIILRGNPFRDIAGRIVSFYHPEPDESLVHESALVSIDKGAVGDITAARKVKVPTISLKEVGEYYSQRKKIPYTWKNSIYLEWFTLQGGRCVLEASELEISSSDPVWKMTDAQEEKARKDAQKGLIHFLDMLGNVDESRTRLDQTLEKSGEELDEFEWEKLFKHSDKVTDRYQELLEKYESDDEKIDELMGWHKDDDEAEFRISEPVEFHDPFEYDADFEAEYEANLKAQRKHPIRLRAKEILISLESARRDEIEKGQKEIGEIWSVMAVVSAKLAGAFSGYRSDDTYEDSGFVIAQLKRVLTHVNLAHDLMINHNHPQVQALMVLRQNIIDLQTKLRG